MGEFVILNLENLDLPEDIINEIVILYNLGVNIEELKYILSLRLNNIY